MFERILLPLDGSELAEMALPYGEELARRLGSEVILFHVRGREYQQYEHMHQMYLDRLAETVAHNIGMGRPKGTEVKVTTEVEVGEPTENICNLVAKNDIGLIIMTAVSASGLKVGKMLGSVADHVCRTVPIPVMLIRPKDGRRIEGEKRLINRILIPMDGSDLSKLALPIGEELAAKLEVSITLFQMARMIIPYAADPMGSIPPVDSLELSKYEENRVRAEMIALEKELKEKGLTVTHSVTSGFDAADEIIEAGKKVDADLVVMSTHGRSGLRRWVLGSVAEKVLRYGEIPILLVNARPD
jgi:nucleotide-binding universal stress UspA family protein